MENNKCTPEMLKIFKNIQPQLKQLDALIKKKDCVQDNCIFQT